MLQAVTKLVVGEAVGVHLKKTYLMSAAITSATTRSPIQLPRPMPHIIESSVMKLCIT